MQAQLYRHEFAETWNTFCRQSAKNATFLFDRSYMDYHSDRFEDHSLIFEDDKGNWKAVLPANRSGTTLHSHQGLSYGGLILEKSLGLSEVMMAFAAMVTFLAERDFTTLHYKTMPSIYQHPTADEDRYCLFRSGAHRCRSDVLTVYDREHPLPTHPRRRRCLKKAAATGIAVNRSMVFGPFWDVLAHNLRERHGVVPVHSVSEIELLAGRFPDSIQLFEAKKADRLLAGAVLYLTDQTCHVQYNAATAEGKQCAALDWLLQHLMESFTELRFFDFGVSTESGGRVLNRGLVDYKEGFGARTFVHDFYEIDLKSAAKEVATWTI